MGVLKQHQKTPTRESLGSFSKSKSPIEELIDQWTLSNT
jgi:hypothetical protein